MASYPDNWVDDGNIWCYYNVTTTESATTLGANTNRASAMWVDGEPVTPANSYTFDTIGEHLVKFTPAQWGRYYFSGSKALVRCYLPTSITYIDDNSFSGCENLTLLNFNSLSITRLGQQAFMNCSNLVMDNLSLPLLDTLGSSALAGCRKLTSIANLGSITSIGAYSFNGCTSLASIVLPATLTSLGNYLFPNSLKTVTSLAETPPTLGSGVFSRAPTAIYVLPSSVQAYKEAAGWSSYANKIYPLWEEKPININHLSLGDFRRRIMMGISTPKPLYPDPFVDDGKVWCYYNVETTESATTLLYRTNNLSAMEVDGISVPLATSYTFNSVGEHLVKFSLNDSSQLGGGDGNWREVRTLHRLYMPNSITSIPNVIFMNCSTLTFIRFSDILSYIGINTFRGCSSLVIDNFKVPYLTSIGTYALGGTKIKKVSDLGQITTLAQECLRGITVLTDVVLPATITEVAQQSMLNCSALKRVVCKAVVPPVLGLYVFYGVNLDTIYVPAESVEAYKSASGWSSYANKIQAIPE